jgi:hypothetical protein
VVGDEIEARCGKCKLDTVHVITAVDETKIKKVMCKICMSYHAYKPAEGDSQEATKKKAAKTTKRRTRRKKDWATLVADIEDASLPQYRITDDYSTSPGVRHAKFGVGVITNVASNKIEVVFQDGIKELVHNWRE